MTHERAKASGARAVRPVSTREREPVADDVLSLQQQVGNRAVSALIGAPGSEQRIQNEPQLGSSASPSPRPRELDIESLGDAAATSLIGRLAARRVADAAGSSRPLGDMNSNAADGTRHAASSDVRVHDGPAAQDAAVLLGAEAFTIANHIYLGKEATPRVIAHELVHTSQQRGAGPTPATIPVAASSSPAEAEALNLASGHSSSAALTSMPATVQRAEDPERVRLRALASDPVVAKQVERAVQKGKDVSGILAEAAANEAIRNRLATPEGAASLLPKGKTGADVRFVPGNEIWTTTGQPFTDGLLLDRIQLERAIAAADGQAAAMKGKGRRARPTAPVDLPVDVDAFAEVKAGETGARKLTAGREDVTKMKPSDVAAARKEHAKVVSETASEAAQRGEAPGDVIKTDIGGQIGEVFERATIEGRFVDAVVMGRRMRLRLSRKAVAIAAVPKGVDIAPDVAKLRDPHGLGLDVRTLSLDVTEKALKEAASELKQKPHAGLPTTPKQAETPKTQAEPKLQTPIASKSPAASPLAGKRSGPIRKVPPGEPKVPALPNQLPTAVPTGEPGSRLENAPIPIVNNPPLPPVTPSKSAGQRSPTPQKSPTAVKPKVPIEPPAPVKQLAPVKSPPTVEPPAPVQSPVPAIPQEALKPPAPAEKTIGRAVGKAPMKSATKPPAPVEKTIGRAVGKAPMKSATKPPAPVQKTIGRSERPAGAAEPVTPGQGFTPDPVAPIGPPELEPVRAGGRVRVGGGSGRAGGVSEPPASLTAEPSAPSPAAPSPPAPEARSGSPGSPSEGLWSPPELTPAEGPKFAPVEGPTGAMEGGGQMLQAFNEAQNERAERAKEAAEYEKLRPTIEAELRKGNFVVVDTTWLRTHDPFGDLAGFHELPTFPKFKSLHMRWARTLEEAQHPRDVGATISARTTTMEQDIAGEQAARQWSEELKQPGRYHETSRYATLIPPTAVPDVLAPRPAPLDLDAVQGSYTAADAPHELALARHGDTLGISAAWRATGTYDVVAQDWRATSPSSGTLTAELVDREQRTLIRTQISVVSNPYGPTLIWEKFTVVGPDGAARTTTVVRNAR